MIELKLLSPPPGAWTTPVLRLVAIDGTEDPNIVRLVFAAGSQLPSGQHELTMGVPISGVDAAGLLDTLRRLQAKGLIPIVPEAPRSKQ